MISRVCYLAVAVWWLLCSAGASAQVLRFAAIPEENAAITQQRFAPLLRYLESRGLTAVWIATPDLASFVEALTARRVDFAWSNGFTFVQARARMGGNLSCIAQRREDTQYQSVFIARDSAVISLEHMAGKSVSFGPRASASAHLMPRHFLKSHSESTHNALGTVRHAASHEAVIDHVTRGTSEVGALSATAFAKLKEDGKVDGNIVRVFHTTPTFHDYCFVVTGDRDPALFTALQSALVGLDPRRTEHQPILQALRASRLIVGADENFIALEAAAKSAGLIK